MKKICILIPEGPSSLSNIEGTYQILSQVNDFCDSMGRPRAFEILLVGLTKESSQRNGLFTIKPDLLINEVDQTNLIIIPAMFGTHESALELNKGFIPWLVKQHKQGAEIATYCIGAFFLASTGLLNGKNCSTHWIHANDFRSLYPGVNLVDDKIMTEADGIYTSGGAYSFLNLLMYLVEKYTGREMAVLIAKTFTIDIDRRSQSPFTIFKGQKLHEDDTIRKAQDFIEANYQDKITVDQLAKYLCLGRRNLERRFRKATSNTVAEYIQRVKMEAAKLSLESSRENVNEVMYKVGYNDNKAFRSTFKKVTGLSPLQYRNKFNRMIAV
jgi:transcriptional regulator GlxA family with amidase domain